MFEISRFIDECRSAVREDSSHNTALAVMRRTFSDPAVIREAFAATNARGLQTLHHAADLTILNVIWNPGMAVPPHNHRMWALIGVYDGREDNIFWKRTDDGGLVAAGAHALCAGDVVPLGPEVIHSVHNPIARISAAIHVYGGDFFAVERSQWDPETLAEDPYDMANTRALFAQK